MPEPLDQSKSQNYVDEYDQDRDDPYWSSDDKRTVFEKVRFHIVPVGLMILFRALLWEVPTTDWNTRYTGFSGSSEMEMEALWGIFGWGLYKRFTRYLGMRPGLLSLRYWVIYGAVVCSCVLSHLTHYSWGVYHQNFDNMHRYAMSSFDHCTRAAFLVTVACTCVCIAPRKYGDNTSAWGVYCCANMPQARVLKNIICETLFWFYWYWMGFYTAVAAVDPVSGPYIPFVIFGWKKVLYFNAITVLDHDCPFKGHAFLLKIWDELLSLNLGITMGAIGVTSWEATMSYIFTDWIIFALRVAVVARTGSRTCPKLSKYLVLKQLENMPAPLLNHQKAGGQKIAMRCVQAYICLVEGETMTTQYLMFMIAFAYRQSIMRDPYILYLVPMKNFWVVAAYSALDFVQDFIADHLTNRFNSWSYLFSNSGWFDRKKYAWMHVYMAYGNSWEFKHVAGTKTRLMMQKPSGLIPIPCNWSWTPPGLHHY